MRALKQTATGITPASRYENGPASNGATRAAATLSVVHAPTTIHYTKETAMNKKSWLTITAATALVVAGVAYAQFPIMDRVADKVVQKYQSSSCEQLWQQKGQPKSEEEQRVIGFLKSDPQMRQAFFNKVSGPIVNKMFECGMIP
jgi:hypothetical protein